MKNTNIITCFLPIILIALLWGCTRDPAMLESEGESRQTTRVAANNHSDYFWYEGEQVPLIKCPEKQYILFKTDQAALLTDGLRQNNIMLKTDDVHDYICEGINKTTGSQLKAAGADNLKWAIIEGANLGNISLSVPEIVYSAPFYKSQSGAEVGLSNLFYVKLRSTDDMAKLIDLAAQHKIEVVGTNVFEPLWVTLSCSVSSTGNALEMSNVFHDANLFAATEPDLMMDKTFNVNDTHFGLQWNLHNTGQHGGVSGMDINYLNAHTITTGDPSVIIAVLDHGIELSHPDIRNLVHDSYDTETDKSPSVIRGSHGTACAGIIGATTNNSLGVAGIASGARLMSISNRLMIGPNDKQSLANGLRWATNHGASVISNSWGHEQLQSPLIEDAIRHALNNGRNGKGCVVVFAAGNGNSSTVGFPARSIADILAVGAMSVNGMRKSPSTPDGEYWGSDYGTELDVMAPGVKIPTTDRTGNDGYNPGDYKLNFNGTSSACPHVAALAGLILSVNPDLTQKEVATIIEKTANKAGGYPYAVTYGRPNGTWYNETGYGLINAYAALSMARDMDINLSDKTFADSRSYFTYKWIHLRNVHVAQEGNLTLEAGKGVQITQPFTVHQNATVVMK